MSEGTGALQAYHLENKKNDRLLELIIEFEKKLTKEIEGNEKISPKDNTFQDGITLGLQTAKSIFLVRVWQEVERLYDTQDATGQARS